MAPVEICRTDQQEILIAVSGGADSTALLLAMHELTTTNKLASTLIVAHLDHGLRERARGDARTVAELAAKLGLRIVIGHADVPQRALETRDNLEQAARKARYAFLERTAKRLKLKHILLAHTMNDQAETVLLRLMRGSGGEGLGGMAGSASQAPFLRPFGATATVVGSQIRY